MASVGPKLTIPFTIPGVVGQGGTPELWAVYTTDDASITSPAWVDASSLVRSASVSRGRQSELQQFDAGTASVILDNRARTFDPVINALVAPMNRWWLRSQFSGETQDLFRGYVERYNQGWSEAGYDATVDVELTDEFKVLALDDLPATSPPRGSYLDLVAADLPDGVWPLNTPAEQLVQEPVTVEANPEPPPGGGQGGSGNAFGQQRGSFGWRP